MLLAHPFISLTPKLLLSQETEALEYDTHMEVVQYRVKNWLSNPLFTRQVPPGLCDCRKTDDIMCISGPQVLNG